MAAARSNNGAGCSVAANKHTDRSRVRSGAKPHPSALPKISTTRILTNSVASCASESAAELPTMPTHSLWHRTFCQSDISSNALAGTECAWTSVFCCQLSEYLHAITVQVIICVCESAPARQVGPAGGQAGRENSVAGEVRLIRPQPGLRRRRHPVDLRLEDNGHDDAIDGHRLAEDDAAAAQEAMLISFDIVQESSQEVVAAGAQKNTLPGQPSKPA